ncbi:MAG TPA: DUF1269 domain-containing protein [Anaerolineae bacterium]|nr:DUF1269 domain-containing protein [Anaerolineae bacterium]MCB0179559.1 DUF1269 domain-containing protein [Anaerolineae bacterium]MCB0222210.1 DUF1269 domain-containing protein [Anaerolineae bacterium]MCB9102946.1 DUF1269 domain-containing protein [Anaerolineales bacterium]HRV92128.1 DUF1269 domain-containing protein [Anaerolineae bacterium]
MSNLVVITFDNPDEAGQVREAIRKVEKQGNISLDDSAVIVKDADGKVHIKNEIDRGVKIGTVGGSLLGLLIGGLFFPIAGLAIGAAGGALVGKMADLGVDKGFVKEVTESLGPGSSAIFLIVRNANPTAAIAALKPYKGELYQTSLEPDTEQALRDVLKERK